jgi:hypothetical protein
MLKKQKETNPDKLPRGLPETPPPFFAQQASHAYGTCWNCGHARETPGGSPGGKEAYWCKHCQKWLTIRVSVNDTRLVNLITTKEAKSKNTKPVVSPAISREDPSVDESNF